VISIEAFKGRPVFQIAFVVRDFDAALEHYDNVLGAGPFRGFTFGTHLHKRAEYRGGPTDFKARLALNDSNPQFELIQPLSGPSAHQEWLDSHGEGFHHVGVIVESVEATTKEMHAAGYETIMAGDGFGADGDGSYAYFDTADALGFVIEAVEPPSKMPGADFVWPCQ
jgi:methylmalonyl-CoA/ethylmalonyl-CoA epimerase